MDTKKKFPVTRTSVDICLTTVSITDTPYLHISFPLKIIHTINLYKFR